MNIRTKQNKLKQQQQQITKAALAAANNFVDRLNANAFSIN